MLRERRREHREKLPVRLLLAASVLLVLAGALWGLLAQWPCAALSWIGAIGCGAAALGISTQPVFTCFGSMEGVHQAVRDAARQVYDDYITAGLREEIPFFGLGMQYIHFAREEPMLYRLLFLAQTPSGGAFAALEHSQALARPSLERIYHLTAAAADRYFRDLWLVVHSLATLIVTGGCPYTDREIGQILTGFSLSICKSIKEVPGFAAGTFDRDAAFRALLGEKE